MADSPEDAELRQLQPERAQGGLVGPAQEPGRHAGMEGKAGSADGFQVGHETIMTRL